MLATQGEHAHLKKKTRRKKRNSIIDKKKYPKKKRLERTAVQALT